jgi:DNA replication initiation complex subunit (GINS family)
MKRNAAKFNGAQSLVTDEANNLYDFVKAEIENERAELTELELAVKEQLSGKKKKKRKKAATKAAAPAGPLGRNVVVKDGVTVDLGDLPGEINFNIPDSDSE